MPQLDGRVIIATGGTQGVGEAVALRAAEQGAAGVVICGRQQPKGLAVAAAIEKLGAEALFVRADLSVVEDCRNIVRQCDQRFGRVDGLVNAAADTNRATLEDATVELWDHQFAVNVRAPFLLTQEVVRIMRREKSGGSIVNILSVAAHCGLPSLTPYSATKGALQTFTKNTANALYRHRIRVHGINLGWTDTPAEHDVQAKQGSPANWLEIGESRSPFGRLIKPLDVARLCTYLLSDESGIVTGSCIDYAQRVIGFSPPDDGRTC
ncbi:MAG: SDR family oxidoreductase [Planctomycetia bacterium]|nr:SDR family oxidoreductase [Planctomycetia bacterium]